MGSALPVVLRVLCVCGLLALAGCGGGGAVEPAAAPAAGGMRVVVIGDFGVGREREQRLGEAVHELARARHVDLLVTVGDNNYASSESSWDTNWSGAFGWVADEGVGVAGALGNHDHEAGAGGRYEFDELDMDSPYYRRRAGDVDFFMLDSNDVSDRQTEWLQEELAQSDARWKIAVFHHPAYTCGSYRNHRQGVARWLPLFQRYGVQLVLNGHDHNYQRFRAPGATYVVDGGGGADLYEIKECPDGHPQPFAQNDDDHSFLELVVGERIVGRALTVDGEEFDRFTIAP